MSHRDWLSGVSFGTASLKGSTFRIILEHYLPVIANQHLSMQLLGNDRMALLGADGVSLPRIETKLTKSLSAPLPCGLRYARARQLLTPRRFRRSDVVIEVSAEDWERSTNLGFSIGTPYGRQSKAARAAGVPWERALNGIYLEIAKSELLTCKAGSNEMFLLISRKQGGLRVTGEAEKRGLLNRDDEATMDALYELTLKVFRGGDTPLLTD